MNKTQLVAAIAEKSGLSKKDAEAALNAFVGVTTDALAKGDNVALIGFGTFEAHDRPARSARNPRTGETIEIAAKKVPAFKAGAALKKAVAD